MAVELFDNEFITTLTADITGSQPTIPVAAVASAALQAAGGQFRIIVDAERMLVTAGANSTTWTVTRGIEGTGAVPHTANTMVAHILTVGGFLNHHTIHEPGGADAFTALDDTNFAAAAKDGIATRPSLRTLGAGAQQAVSGTDARLSDARNPLAHAPSHRYTGSDPLYELVPTSKSTDYAAVVGDLVLMSGAHTVTLPTAPANSTQVGVVALSGQTTIARGGSSDTITVAGVANQTSFSIQTGTSAILYYFNGAWYALQSAGSSGGGGGGTSLSPVSASADTLASANQLVLMTGAHTITLPNAPPLGTQVGAYALTAACSLARSGTDVIEFAGATPANTLVVPSGTEYVLEYYNGVWYGAGAISSAFTPPARAYKAANQNIPASTTVKVALDTKSFDPGGNFDVTTNNRYVCPQAGYYTVDAALTITPGADQGYGTLFIYKNGAAVSQVDIEQGVTSGGFIGASVSDTIQCNAGDYLELWVQNSQTLAATIDGGSAPCFMAVSQVGQIGTAPPGQGIATQARAYRNAAMSALTPSTWTKIPVDTVAAGNDPGGNFNLTSGRYVCPVTGYYQVDGAASVNSTAVQQSLTTAIYKNGVEYSQGNFSYNNNTVQSMNAPVSDVVYCQAGDYIELFVWANGALTPNVGSIFSYLSVYQVAGANAVGALSPTAQSAPYQAGPGQLVLMTGANAVTLPSAPQAGTQVQVTALTASVPVNRGGADTINNMGVAGLQSLTVNAGQSIVFSYLGGVWYASPTGGGSSLAPPARVSGSAVASLTASTWTKIQFNTKTFDPGGNFDTTSTYRYVVPVGGVYEVNASVTASATAAGQTMNCAIYKNGVAVTQGPQIESNIAGTIGASVADFVQCVAGDYLEVFAFSSAGLAIATGTNQTYFSVGQVGVTGTPSPGQGQTTVARAYRNAALNTVNAWTIVPLDTSSFDPGANLVLASNRYVCPKTGYYSVEGSVFVTATAAGQVIQAGVYQNGVRVSFGPSANSQAAGGWGANVSDVLFCQAGDYLQFAYFSNSTGLVINVGATSVYFTVEEVTGTNLIGALSPTAQTANYSAGAGQLVMMTGQNTVTLPNAPMAGSQVGVNALTNTVTIARSGTDTVNYSGTSGQTSITVPQGTIVVLTYLNGVWYGAGPTVSSLVPPARAYRNAALTSPANTQAKVPLDTKNFDAGGNFDVTTNNRWVCPASGTYEVRGDIAITTTATGQRIAALIYKNGALISSGSEIESSATGQVPSAVVTDIVQLNAGDYIELWVFTSAALAVSVGSAVTFLAINQVSGVNAPQPLAASQGIATQAKAYRTAGFTIPVATWTKLPLDTVGYDPGGNIVIGSSRYVCPTTGYYLVDAQLMLAASANSQSIISIYKNGVEASRGNGTGSAGSQQSFTATDILQCNAGDYIEVYCYSTNGQAIAGGSATTDFLAVVQVAGANLIAALSPTAQTAPYAAGPGQLVLMTGANAVTLPNAPQAGTQVGVNALTNSVPVNRAGTDTINYGGTSGQTSLVIPVGVSAIFTYLNGAWYGAGPQQTNFVPPARAHRTAALAIPATTATKVALDTKDYDAGGNVDVITNGRWTCPAAGVYEIEAQLDFNVGATNMSVQLYLYKNGAQISQGSVVHANSALNSEAVVVFADALQLNAGDYLELYAYSTAACNLYVGTAGRNFLSVQQASGTGAPAPTPGQGIATQARAYRNAAFTLTGAFAKIALDTLAFDSGNNMDVTINRRYVCPVTGYYQVDYEVIVSQSAVGQYVSSAVYKNGALATENQIWGSVSAGSLASGGSDIIFCQAGDYLELWAAGTATSGVPGAAFTYLSVAQVGGSNIVGSLSPTAQTADYTAGAGQSVLMTGQHNYTLPNAPQNGTEEEIAALTGHVKVLRQGTDTITYGDTGLAQIWVPQGTVFRLRYLNGVWYVVNNPIGATDHLQNGVVNTGDLAVTAVSVASGTGAITFTVASGVAWVRTNNGILVRVPVIGQSFTLSPASLPAAGQQAVFGIELAQSGNVLLSAKGTDTATVLNTPSLVATNSPATTGGRMRFWDVVVVNTAGSYSLGGTQLDRRPWARGALSSASQTSLPSGVGTSMAAVPGVAARIECTGAPIRFTSDYSAYNSASAMGASVAVYQDGVQIGPTGNNEASSSGFAYNIALNFIRAPTAGSHLFQLYHAAYNSGTLTLTGAELDIEELIRANTNNGTT